MCDVAIPIIGDDPRHEDAIVFGPTFALLRKYYPNGSMNGIYQEEIIYEDKVGLVEYKNVRHV